MKRILVLSFVLGLFIIFRPREQGNVPLDAPLQRAIASGANMRSYSVTIEDFDAYGRTRSDIAYVVNGSDWTMTSVMEDMVIFEWRKIGQDLFVLNADTGWYWRKPNMPMPLPKHVGISEAIAEIQGAREKDRLDSRRMGSEPCGIHLCWRYQLNDALSPLVERYWWVDASTFRLVKDQTVAGNGETSIVTYDYEKEAMIEAPAQTKDIPEGESIMTLPGIVKNLSNLTPQKSV